MSLKKSLRIGLAALLLSTATTGASFAVTLPAVFAGGEVGTGIYIDADYAASLAGQPGVKLIDIRSPEAYAEGHIEGAISIPLASISVEANGLRHQLAGITERQDIFAAAGLSYDDTLVLIGDNLAGRAYIGFDQSGFEKIHVVEGGIAKWPTALTTAATEVTPSNFVLDRPKAEVVDKEYVLSKIGVEGVYIIDSRGDADFNAGSIPGSYNIPIWVSHFEATLQDPTELAAALEAIGLSKDSEIITTCGSGNVASNQLTALRDLGYTNVKIYDGSWDEWVADPSTPKAVKS